LALGLVLEEGLYYSKGFGFSDSQETRRPDEETVFRAGSLSKVMTGTALLTLIDDPTKHMSPDDSADEQRYLPELKFVCPIWDQSCTRGSQHLGVKLKHLVSYTAGLADVMEQTNADVDPWLSDLKKSWLLFEPGTFGSYSGVGVEGVGLIERRISGQSYPDFAKNNLFEPLGMRHSTMDPMTLAANQQA
jgi:CubicO group peptidase (beta-lactamase class C family)